MSTRKKNGRRGSPPPRLAIASHPGQTVEDFQQDCTRCRSAVRWITWDQAVRDDASGWFYEARREVYAQVAADGGDVEQIGVWVCRRTAKHRGITFRAWTPDWLYR